MAVQIINQMPDAQVHRGDLGPGLVREFNAPRSSVTGARFTGRAGFMAITVAVHLVAALAFMQMQHRERVKDEPTPIEVSLVDAPAAQTETPPEYSPPLANIVYAVQTPHDVTFETETITTEVAATTTAPSTSQTAAPAMVESVEYVRAPAPVYPSESSRKRERGTVVLRVVVDVSGKPAQILIERSSGYARLDTAAREAVERALFHPYEVNGVAQPAQVLIPIEFTRRTT
jgi:protein TonB